jgi:UrcA family protein
MIKSARVAAGVSLAVLSIVSVAAPVRADEIRIRVSDLNLKLPEGRAAFNARIERAARELCAGDFDMHLNMACRRAVREEAYENLREQQIELARKDQIVLAQHR